MPRPNSYRPQPKDMYWFAHGGIEPPANQPPQQPRSNIPGPGDTTEDESSDSSSLTWKSNSHERRANSEEPASITSKTSDQPDGVQQSVVLGKLNSTDKRLAVEERRRQLQEAEQEKNEAIMRKHAEREAALEARRNAQRSNISFAFGSAVPPNAEMDIVPVQVSSTHAAVQPRSNAGSANLMSQSMTGSISTSRGRRKNDLTPTVPYDRVGPSRPSAPSRKRSVSMSRLDILAQPRRPYVEAHKANSTMSNSSSNKDARHSPNRPLSAASDKAGGSKALSATAVITRRPQTGAARKSRPVSIAGSIPDAKKPVRTSTPMRSNVRPQPESPNMSIIASNARGPRAKSVSSTDRARKPAAAEKQKSPVKATTPQKHDFKSGNTTKPSPGHKLSATVPKQTTPKVSPAKKPSSRKLVSTAAAAITSAIEKEVKAEKEPPKRVASPARSASPDEDSQSADEKNSSKRIISEEEAKAALAEKRRLAREQAEREAELERQRQEELKRQEEERQRQEEEEQRRMEEEQIRLLEEHRRCEEEKLKKAIEEQERKEEEEKARREEEARLKAEQEKRAKEEAEKQRIELEEKLRKEEEERAERKKRLEKIMSRTRGKSSGTASPSGSGSGSDQPDSVESQHDALSSELSSLESNATAEQYQVHAETINQAAEQHSPTESLDVVNQTLFLASQSLSSNDLMIPSSGNTSLDAQVMPSEHESLDSNQELTIAEDEDTTQAEITQIERNAADAEEHSIDEGPTLVPVDESLTLTQVTDSFGMSLDENVLDAQGMDHNPAHQMLPQEVAFNDSIHGQQFVEEEHAGGNDLQQAFTAFASESTIDQPEALDVDSQETHAESDMHAVPEEHVTGSVPASDVPSEGKDEVPTEDQSHPHSENLAEPFVARVSEQKDTSGMPFSELDEVIQKNTDAELVFCSIPARFSGEAEPHAEDRPVESGGNISEFPESSQDVEGTGKVDVPNKNVLVGEQLPAADASMFDPDEDVQKHSDAELVTCLPSSSPVELVPEDSLLTRDSADENAPAPSKDDFSEVATGSQDPEIFSVHQSPEDVTLSVAGSTYDTDPAWDEHREKIASVGGESNPFDLGEPMNSQRDTGSTSDTVNESLMTQSVVGGEIFQEKFSNSDLPEAADDRLTGKDNLAADVENSKNLVSSSQTAFETYSVGEHFPDDMKVGELPEALPPTGFSELVDTGKEVDDSNSELHQEIESSNAKHISIADELAAHQVNDFSDENAFDAIPAQAGHQDDLMTSVYEHHSVSDEITSSTGMMLTESFIDGGSAIQQRTQNPFGDVDDIAFEANKPISHADVREELLASSLSYADDSEGSSLDSNLSQILNVHSENVTNLETAQDGAVQDVVKNGDSSPNFGHQDGLGDPMESLFSDNSLSKSNGYSMNMNERIFDCRFESVDHKTDSTSVLSDDFHHPVNGKIISGMSTSAVDNADSINSNKVASNPFLGASDSNPFAANPFQVHEEKTFTA